MATEMHKSRNNIESGSCRKDLARLQQFERRGTVRRVCVTSAAGFIVSKTTPSPKSINGDGLEMMVLDECDLLLSFGHEKDIKYVFERCRERANGDGESTTTSEEVGNEIVVIETSRVVAMTWKRWNKENERNER